MKHSISRLHVYMSRKPKYYVLNEKPSFVPYDERPCPLYPVYDGLDDYGSSLKPKCLKDSHISRWVRDYDHMNESAYDRMDKVHTARRPKKYWVEALIRLYSK